MKRILIVDEDERFLLSLQTMLEREGHDITCASNARQAYKEIEISAFNLVLSNVSVPYASGYELLVTMKETAKQRKRKMPVLVVSDMANDTVIADCMNLGIDGYVTKPLYIPDFMRKVNHFLDINF